MLLNHRNDGQNTHDKQLSEHYKTEDTVQFQSLFHGDDGSKEGLFLYHHCICSLPSSRAFFICISRTVCWNPWQPIVIYLHSIWQIKLLASAPTWMLVCFSTVLCSSVYFCLDDFQLLWSEEWIGCWRNVVYHLCTQLLFFLAKGSDKLGPRDGLFFFGRGGGQSCLEGGSCQSYSLRSVPWTLLIFPNIVPFVTFPFSA